MSEFKYNLIMALMGMIGFCVGCALVVWLSCRVRTEGAIGRLIYYAACFEKLIDDLGLKQLPLDEVVVWIENHVEVVRCDACRREIMRHEHSYYGFTANGDRDYDTRLCEQCSNKETG